MKIKHCDTAILLFARSAKSESEHKRLSHSQMVDEKIYQSIIEHTLYQIKRSGFPFYHFTEQNQIGDSFSERLANAMENLIAKGYQKIICVGGDCVEMKSADLIKAQRHLDENDFVLGPDRLGGLYLIALNASAYNRSVFEFVIWQKNQDFDDLCQELYRCSYSITFLPRKSDIDDLRTLQNLADGGLLDNKFLSSIKYYIRSNNKPVLSLKIFVNEAFLHSFQGLRAPPF